MPGRIGLASVTFILCFGCLDPSQALAAADQIGLAVTVRNDVSQVEPKISRILAGDDLIRDEVVQTRTDSGANLFSRIAPTLCWAPTPPSNLIEPFFRIKARSAISQSG